MALNKQYFRDKKREQRKREKELGVRYRGWEQMPGESFTDFKRRMRSVKIMGVISLGAAFFFQLPIL